MPSSPVEAARDDESVPPAEPVAASRRWAGVVGIAVFVAAVWIVTTGGSFNRTQQPAIQPTPTPNPSLTAPETDPYLIDLNTGEMTQLPKRIAGFGYVVSPDGTMVAYTSGDDPARPQVFIASLDGQDVQQVTHDQRGAWGPAWSPDGAAIAYTSGGLTSGDEDVGNIFVLDPATGETSQVTNEKRGPPGAAYPQFSSDGASIIYDLHRGGDADVRIVPVTGGKSALLVGGAALGTLSPDGSTLAVACSGRLEGICIANADGTNLRVLVNGPFPSLLFPRWSPDGTRIAYLNFENDPDFRVLVVDVVTGEATFVAEGVADDWLDDHTLIVRCGIC